MKKLLPAAIAATALVFTTANTAMAQQKKKVPPAQALAYKQCCDRANARFYVHDNKATCFAMSERQQEALTACVYERGIRVEWQGQKGI